MEKFQNSPKAKELLEKAAEINIPLNILNRGQSFCFPIDKYDYETLCVYAAINSSKGKRYYVVKWGEVIEFGKLPEEDEIQDTNLRALQKLTVIRSIDSLKTISDDTLNSYDQNGLKLKQVNMVSRTYLQRRTASTAAFRAAANRSVALDNTLADLVKEGFLKEVDKAARKFQNVSGDVYEVLKNAN